MKSPKRSKVALRQDFEGCIALAEEQRQEARATLDIVRRAVEDLGVGFVQSDGTVGREAHHEAEAIIAAIHKLHDRLTRPHR